MKLNEIYFDNFKEAEQKAQEEFDFALREVKNNCGKFLRESEEMPLFRGQKNAKTNYKNTTHDVREPLSSSKFDSGLFDLYVEERYGIENMRVQNALFCTPKPGDARTYGKVHYIFIPDGFQFIWSSEIIDYYDSGMIDTFLENIATEYGDEDKVDIDISNLKKYIKDHWPPTIKNMKGCATYNKIKSLLIDTFDEFDYSIHDLGTALSTGNEITFRTKYFYSFNDEIVNKYIFADDTDARDKFYMDKNRSYNHYFDLYKKMLEKIYAS
jgi:hypothetical protein